MFSFLLAPNTPSKRAASDAKLLVYARTNIHIIITASLLLFLSNWQLLRQKMFAPSLEGKTYAPYTTLNIYDRLYTYSRVQSPIPQHTGISVVHGWRCAKVKQDRSKGKFSEITATRTSYTIGKLQVNSKIYNLANRFACLKSMDCVLCMSVCTLTFL